MRTFIFTLRLFAPWACVAIASVGCSPTIRKPQLFGQGPGPAPFQRYNAEQFDPFPPNDVAPEISGGRPIDFLVPRNEVARTRQYINGERPAERPGPVALGPIVPPSAPVLMPPPSPAPAPAPIYSSPPPTTTPAFQPPPIITPGMVPAGAPYVSPRY